MTNYLFGMGHKDIAFVGNLLYTGSITDRYFGYARSLLEHGVDIRKEWILEDRDSETGRTDGGFEIKLPEEMPTAFVCNCDVSVVGYDNYQPPGLCDIRITSYEVDMTEMARKTVRNIIRKISGEHYKQGVLIVEGRIEYKDSVAKCRK